jgi:hypothetical protein
MGRSSKCIVIDTDIARAASPRDTIDPRPKDCHKLLVVVRDTKHRVVWTEAIRTEWKKHQSQFTQTWFASMIARKQVCWINAPTDDQLRGNIERHTVSEKKRDAMLKDTHLIEAALQADKIVISMDEKVRHAFGEVTQKIQPLALIVWGNPCVSEEAAIDWLQHGAPLEKERLLGYSKENNPA